MLAPEQDICAQLTSKQSITVAVPANNIPPPTSPAGKADVGQVQLRSVEHSKVRPVDETCRVAQAESLRSGRSSRVA
jgi:hypothetical protein